MTLTNGQPGVFSDTSQTPFVMSEIPVVGGGEMAGPLDPLAALGTVGKLPPMGDPRVHGMPQPAGNPGNGPGTGTAAANVAAARFARQLFVAQESTAGRAAPSVAEARRLHALDKAAEGSDVGVLMEKARTAEEEGKPGVAKIYYQMVAKRASGDLKAKAQARSTPSAAPPRLTGPSAGTCSASAARHAERRRCSGCNGFPISAKLSTQPQTAGGQAGLTRRSIM